MYLNATEIDIKELIKLISKGTGKSFLLDDSIHGKVTIISDQKLTMQEAYEAFLSALAVAGYATVEGPANLIKVVPRKDAIQYPIKIYKGTSPITDDYITRIVTLSNISALDLSTLIKGLVSKDGNLLAFPSTNTLIVTDTGTNIHRLMEIIGELDQAGPQQIIEIVPVQNADAKDITEKLNQLYDTGEGGQGKTGQVKRKKKAGEVDDDVPSVSKVIPDERTNSIIILGTKRGIGDLKEIIAQLDTPISGAEGAIHVHYLRNAVSSELAQVLANLTGSAPAKKEKGEKETGAPTAEFEGGIKITADDSTNSLVVVASPKDYQTLVERVISKLDIPRRQVYLEVVVMEISTTKSNDFLPLGHGGKSFSIDGRDIIGFGSLFAPLTDLGTLSALGGVSGGAVSEDNIDVPAGNGETLSIPALGVAIHALASNQYTNLLSTPSLLTLDNEEAEIEVGDEIPFITSSTLDANGRPVNTITREDVGVLLKITPQINESDAIRLKISQEVSNVRRDSATTTDVVTSKRSVTTVVVADNKQTIVIGGLLQDNTSSSITKIPIFGDIPLVGNLFKQRQKNRVKNNILVFITPYIIRDRSDFMVVLKRKIDERNQFIDYNYGKSQASQIRSALRQHADYLLEYREGKMSPYYEEPPAEKAARLEKETIARGATPIPARERRQYREYRRSTDVYGLEYKDSGGEGTPTLKSTAPAAVYPYQSTYVEPAPEPASVPASTSTTPQARVSAPAPASTPAAEKSSVPTSSTPKKSTGSTPSTAPESDGSIWSTQ